MKLIIQIPCLNEEQHLTETFSDLPRSIHGVDEIEVLIIDDGSTDKTSDIARNIGAHHILRFPKNRGLAVAHMAGLDACYRLGADIVVNTDADNQYQGADISKLVQPVIAKRADIAIGDRQVNTIQSFSPTKKLLQYCGSRLVRGVSGVNVTDATSGFRAINRKAISRLFVHNKFTYTLETLIQAGNAGLNVENVKIVTNRPKRESRLFSSITEYLRRNGLVIFRSYAMYSPIQVFGTVAGLFFLMGSILCLRFLYYYVANPQVSSHIQSLQIGTGLVIISFIISLLALLADLIATNRRLTEELLTRMRSVESIVQIKKPENWIEGLESTKNESWKTDNFDESQ